MAEETKENEKQLLLDLQQSNEVIDLFGSMQLVNKNTVVDKLVETELTKKGKLRANEMCFYRVKQLSFDEDYPHREAFENVLLSMDNDAFNFVYVLTGTEEGIELCLGVVQNQNENVRPFLFRRRLPMITKNINARYLIIVMIMEVMY